MKLRFVISFLLVSFFAQAQQYGNEWINFSQQYFKFEVTQDGIYRINKSDLLSAGFPVNSVSSANFQVYGRGVEIPIHVEGTGTSWSYIEFYAQRNDAWLDSVLFEGAENVTNPYTSIIENDTASYFITYDSNSSNNKRYTITNDQNFGAYSKASFYLQKNPIEYRSNFNTGYQYADKGYPSGYQKGEGKIDDISGRHNQFISNVARTNSRNNNFPITKNFDITNLVASGGDLKIDIAYVGKSTKTHKVNYTINGKTFAFPETEGDSLFRHSINVPQSDVISDKATLVFSTTTDVKTTDNSALANALVTYPHSFDMDNDKLNTLHFPISNNKKTVEYSSFNSNNKVALAYNISSNERTILTSQSGVYKQVLSASSKEQMVVLVTEDTISSISTFEKVNFIDYKNSIKDYQFIGITHSSLNSEALNYINYRKSTGLTSILVDIDQLYDQFAYGIKKQPLSIKNFIRYAYETWGTKPEYLFLIGKGVTPDYGLTNNLVPTYGIPGSDQMYIAGLDTSKFDSPIQVGRIAATTNQQIADYLNKVKEYEVQSYDEWMKRAIHFSGGANAGEQQLFKSYVDNYTETFENSSLGGIVLSESKASSQPFDISLQDSITNSIENGAALITFFGHAAGTGTGGTGGFDVSLDNVKNWKNGNGKYPILIANSCYTGNMFTSGTNSTSEQYLLEANKGVIAYYAHGGAGYSTPLHDLTRSMYEEFCTFSYGETVGKVVQENIRKMQGSRNSEFYRTSYYSVALHGDPAVKLVNADRPDYQIEKGGLYFSPDNVTSDLQSFTAYAIVKNVGKVVSDAVTVRLIRKYEQEKPQPKQDTVYSVQIPILYYKDTVSFTLDIDPLNGDGTNQFEVVIDPLSEIAELNETNNSLKVNLVITSGVVTPTYPYQYQVVPNKDIVLRGVTADPFLKEARYYFQVSKNSDFSNLIENSSILATGGVVEYPFNNMTDNDVYFWRISTDTTKSFLWRSSSFQYINGQKGWGQANFGQHAENNLTFLDVQGTEFKFQSNTKKAYIYTTDGSPSGRTGEIQKVGFYLNNSRIENDACRWAKLIMVSVLDGKTLEPWGSTYFPAADGTCDANEFNHYNCDLADVGNININGCGSKTPPDNYFVFLATDIQKVTDFIDNKVKDGDYVALWNFRQVDWRSFNQTIIDKFKGYGAKAWDIPDTIHGANLNGLGYAMVFKKGDSLSMVEAVSDTGSRIVELFADVNSEFPFGEQKTKIIGPATSWEKFDWNYTDIDNSDNVEFDVLGIKPDGQEEVLFDNLSGLNGSQDLSGVDANVYPNLRLNMLMQDATQLSPAKLNSWHVYLGGYGDAAFNPKKGFTTSRDTLGEGENFELSIAIENISDFDMDSLLVSLYIEDVNRVVHTIPNVRLDSILANDTVMLRVAYPTFGLKGLNKLWIELNPNNDQPEQYKFNNFATHQFYVSEDSENPILDVTIDGRHILSGDIVSPTPHFLIKLADEHPNLALNDTSLMQIYLSKDKGPLQQIYFTNSASHSIDYTLASLPDNSINVNYYPTLDDGNYTLTVKSIDRSNNRSGKFDYTVNFEVITKSSITKVLNWPNPFSTSTRFVFELTGSKIPTEFKVQILAVDGTVVKEITKDEIGPIKIGRNISEYAWDGTDTYGDRLANGVYFYRVVTNLNGNEIENRKTEADAYFNQGFGKMYLIR